MKLYQGTAANSSSNPEALADALMLFAAAADYAAGEPPEDGEKIASVAVAITEFSELSEGERDALAFAARLRNIGALGNPAFAKTAGELPERLRVMLAWDIPVAGARLCDRIAALPPQTADMIRWQREAWDGTGFPDQLRWHGIPKSAQILNLARTFVSEPDPEEAHTAIVTQSGRTFSPEQTRSFVMWYHTYGGEIASKPLPLSALKHERTHPSELLQIFGEAVDAHNGTPGRWQQVAQRAERLAARMKLGVAETNAIALASLFYGIGEIRAAQLESHQFDPLSRIGTEMRAEHATAAAKIVERFATFADLAPVLAARAEWYDGTGLPRRLRHDATPVVAQILAVCIAYEDLEERYRSVIGDDRQAPIDRLEAAAGTQFDPHIVRALSELVKTHA